MFKSKKPASVNSSRPAPENQFRQAINYEEERISFQKKSQRIAWIIASVACVLLVLSWIGLFLLLPLKEVRPYVIRVDKSGIPDVVTGLDEQTLSSDEALDRYFINQYVQLREGYTYQTIQKTYDLTQLYSSSDVAAEFIREYDQKDSLDKTLKKGSAAVKVMSINLDQVNDTKLATVRFEVRYITEDKVVTTKYFSARLAYKYNPKVKLKLSYRIENPVGFMVTSYQRSEESL